MNFDLKIKKYKCSIEVIESKSGYEISSFKCPSSITLDCLKAFHNIITEFKDILFLSLEELDINRINCKGTVAINTFRYKRNITDYYKLNTNRAQSIMDEYNFEVME